EYLAGGQELADIYRGLNAIHVGHDDVADYQVRLNRAGAFHGCGAGVNRGGVIAMLIENDSQRVCDNAFIIHHQDPRSGLFCHARPLLLNAAAGRMSKATPGVPKTHYRQAAEQHATRRSSETDRKHRRNSRITLVQDELRISQLRWLRLCSARPREEKP